jgi:hypothetical protein
MKSIDQLREGKYRISFRHKHPDGEKFHHYDVSAPNLNKAHHKAIDLHLQKHPNTLGHFSVWDSQRTDGGFMESTQQVDENTKKKHDSMLVVHGVMSRDEFNRKWGKKKPSKHNPIAGPGGVYKNVTRSEGTEPVAEGLEDACWKGYEAIGMKMKNGKKVPNCVPKEGHVEDAQTAHQAAHAALKKGDVDTYHKEMDKKFASHQAAAAEAGKKPVKTFEGADEQKNLKITKHEKAAVEASKRGDTRAQQYHLDIVKSLKNESTEVVTEAKKASDLMQKHLVTVTVSDPQHSMVSKRKEKIMKRARVTGKDPKDAVEKAEAHYKRHGYKVHDSLHHSIVTESLDSDEIIDQHDLENENHGHTNQAPQEGVTQNDDTPEGEEDKEETIQRLKLLIRLGFLELPQLPIAMRVINRLEKGQTVAIEQEREVLTLMVEKLLGLVTGDEFIFRRSRQLVQK